MRAVLPSRTIVDSAGIAQLARIKGLAAAGLGDILSLAEQYGDSRVQNVIKANVPGMGTGNAEELVDVASIVSGFVDLLAKGTVFPALLRGGMIEATFGSRAQVVALDASAAVIGEGLPVPLTGAGYDLAEGIRPQIAAGLLVITKQLLMAGSAEATLSRALRQAVGRALDLRFFAAVIDGDTPTETSAGGDVDGIRADMRTLVDAIAPTPDSRLMWVLDPVLQRRTATLGTATGEDAFPGLTVTGGELAGIPAMPSAAVGSGNIALIDATRLAGRIEDVQIDASGEADVEMLDAALQQNATTGASANVVSMFQTNSVAIRGTATFGVQRLRDDAIAVIEDATWGSEGVS